MLRLVVTGGGTGGHIYPALAVAEHFKGTPGAEITFIGSSAGLEGASARAAGLRFVGLDLSGVAGKNPLSAAKALLRFAAATLRCRRLFNQSRPDCVVGTGGYAAAPASFAAAWMKVPLVTIEPNFEPGLVTRLLSRRARAVAVAFEGTARLLPRKATVLVTGVPVRLDIERLAGDEARNRSRDEAMRFFGLEAGLRTLLAFGGSQGAQALNDAVWAVLEDMTGERDVQVLHLTGKAGFDDRRRSAAEKTHEGDLTYRVLPYCDRMELAYAVADLAVARAGAGTVAELAAAALPAVLVPYPYASGHQEMNARELAAAGGAIVVAQDGESAERAVREAFRLLEDEEELRRMRSTLRARRAVTGTEGIAALVEELT